MCNVVHAHNAYGWAAMKEHCAEHHHGRSGSWSRFGGGDRSSLPVPALVSVLGLAVLLATLLLSSSIEIRRAEAATVPSPPNTPPTLLVLGDSVILGTYNNIPNDLPGWQVTMDAAVSRSTAAGLDALTTHGTAYDAVVVELGTNDGGTPGVFQPRVAALMNALAPVPHVYWLTIHEARPYYATTNAIIRSEAAARSNVTVADWNAAILPNDVGDDGLHLTPSGSVHMAAFVAGVVNAGFVADATTTVPSTEPATTLPVPPTTVAVTTLPATTRPAPTDPRVERRGIPTSAVASSPRQHRRSGGVPLWAWLLPVVGVAVGAGGLLAWRLRRGRPHAGEDSSAPPTA